MNYYVIAACLVILFKNSLPLRVFVHSNSMGDKRIRKAKSGKLSEVSMNTEKASSAAKAKFERTQPRIPKALPPAFGSRDVIHKD
jgi:hypothetical protein